MLRQGRTEVFELVKDNVLVGTMVVNYEYLMDVVAGYVNSLYSSIVRCTADNFDSLRHLATDGNNHVLNADTFRLDEYLIKYVVSKKRSW